MTTQVRNYMARFALMSDEQIIKHHQREGLPVVFGAGGKVNRRATLLAAVTQLAVRQEAEARP
jgi:hypothetical protein